MKYKYFALKGAFGDCVYRLPDGAFIPMDLNNGDYRRYCEWCDKGNKTHGEINNPDDAVKIAEKIDSNALGEDNVLNDL